MKSDVFMQEHLEAHNGFAFCTCRSCHVSTLESVTPAVKCTSDIGTSESKLKATQHNEDWLWLERYKTNKQ